MEGYTTDLASHGHGTGSYIVNERLLYMISADEGKRFDYHSLDLREASGPCASARGLGGGSAKAKSLESRITCPILYDSPAAQHFPCVS